MSCGGVGRMDVTAIASAINPPTHAVALSTCSQSMVIPRIALGGAACVRQNAAAPILAVMRQQHPFGKTRRARGVGLDGHGIRGGLKGLERTKIQKALKTIRTEHKMLSIAFDSSNPGPF